MIDMLSDKEVRKIKRELKTKSQSELIEIIINQKWIMDNLDLQVASMARRFDPSQHRSIGGITVPKGF